MFKAHYEEDDNIVYIEAEGEVYREDLIKYIEFLENEFRHMKDLNVIEDVRKTIPKFSDDDFLGLLERSKESLGHFREINYATVVEGPLETALSVIYEDFSRGVENYYFRTFSTTEAARAWITKKTG